MSNVDYFVRFQMCNNTLKCILGPCSLMHTMTHWGQRINIPWHQRVKAMNKQGMSCCCSVQGPNSEDRPWASHLSHLGGDWEAGGRQKGGRQCYHLPQIPHVPLWGGFPGALQWQGLQDCHGSCPLSPDLMAPPLWGRVASPLSSCTYVLYSDGLWKVYDFLVQD